MEANIQDLTKLFQTPVSYRIPVFQRPYAWTREQQWQPLWEDVKRKSEELLFKTQNQTLPPHFMGAIVLQLQTSITGQVVKRIVVDGQQRLTTLQILLQASRSSFLAINDSHHAKELTSLIENPPKYYYDDLSNQTKVRQSNISDLQSFQDVVRDTVDLQAPLRPIGEAYKFFTSEIIKWLQDPTKRSERAGALTTVLTEHLQLATVDLDQDEKPHFIFAVLNARAEPLKESDHIKNTVMFQANVVDDESKATDLWGPFDRNPWWRNTTKEGRLTRIHLDRFLNYWVVMSLGTDVSADRVSSEFSTYIDSNGLAIEEIASNIQKAGQVYEDMELSRQPGIEMFLTRMKALELGVVMPPLLWLYTNDIPDDKRRRVVRSLESYLVRRVLCGFGSQGLNRLFVELLSRMKQADSQDVDQVTIEFLSDQIVDNRIFPTDDMLREYLIGIPMKGNARRQAMVLEAVELNLRSDMTEAVAQERLTLEHIMPRSWQTNWPLPKDCENDHDAVTARERAIKEIGNLTLTSGKLNQSLSNGKWSEKRKALKKHTVLRLNLDLLDNYPGTWDEKAIRGRSEQLVSTIAEIWPYADKI